VLIRVDDFPSGNTSASLPMPEGLISQAYKDLLKMHAIIAAPFILGVTPCMITDKWVDSLLALPNLEIAVHGLTHRRGEFLARDEERLVKSLGSFRIRFSTGVFIPPFNYLDNSLLTLLHRSGFKTVCTGPESYRVLELNFTDFSVVQSSWYGYSRDIEAMFDIEDEVSSLDCMTLHLPWENSMNFKPLQILMQRLHKLGVKIYSWSKIGEIP